jgi:Spy/CpxP family protein refolding chaperone
MIGFAIGIACLFALGRVLRGGWGHRRWGYGRHAYGGCGYGGGGYGGCGPSDYGPAGGDCGPEDCGPGGGHDHFRGGFRGGWGRRGWGGSHHFLSGILQWIDAGPTQRKAVQEAVDDVLDKGGKLREQVISARHDVAEAFRSESFDENIMADLLTRHDDAIDEMRKSVVGALAKVHANLDPKQREQIARFLSRGPGGGGFRGAHV